MAASPFAYFRGAALPMAADLATVAQTGVRVQLYGDAHLSNFGGFASPKRDLVFDVNDFDETHPGPFEWDVKRLAASLEIAGRGRGFDAATNRKIVLQGVRTYRETVRQLSQLPKLDIWYAKLDVPAVLAIWGNDIGNATLASLQRAVTKAGSKDRLKAFAALMALLAACATTHVPPSGYPSTSTSTTSTATTTGPVAPSCGVVTSPDVVITSRIEPCAVTTHVGSTVHIVLDPGFRWDGLKSDSDVVQVGGIQRPSSGGLTADLYATAVGQATVTAVGTLACAPGQPCPALARQWSLHLTITHRPAPSQTIAVTEADSGRSYTLHRGDQLDVELSGPSSYTWTKPTSSDQGALDPMATSSGSTARASFVAVGPGKATVTATDNPNCYPECLAPSRLFEVSVSVTG